MSALWMHNVRALTPCLSINIFWKHLDESMYQRKDLYGNKVRMSCQACVAHPRLKDVLPVAEADKSMDNVLQLLKQLPKDHLKFYAARMAQQLLDLE